MMAATMGSASNPSKQRGTRQVFWSLLRQVMFRQRAPEMKVMEGASCQAGKKPGWRES